MYNLFLKIILFQALREDIHACGDHGRRIRDPFLAVQQK